MSTPPRQKRFTPADITALKGIKPIVSLTAYTTPVARILDRHCDLLLVGDSLGMVLYGMDTTVGVTMDMMVAHGQAAMRGATRACVIVDLPFGSYQESKEQAFRNAVRLMKETGCDGVKLEGGAEMAETVEFLVSRGVPVFGHIGLMPQQVNTSGGYRSKGHSEAEQEKIRRDAKAIDEAGAFAMVIEGTVEKAENSGALSGRANISLNFDTIRLNGRTYRFAGIIESVTTANGDSVSVNNEGTVRDSNQTTKTATRAGIGAVVVRVAD